MKPRGGTSLMSRGSPPGRPLAFHFPCAHPQMISRRSVAQVTNHDYHVTMKTVRIADLKARLSEHIRTVRSGRSVTVLDRDTPVAQLVPIETSTLEIRQATRRPKDLPPSPRRGSRTDSLALLLEDRRRR